MTLSSVMLSCSDEINVGAEDVVSGLTPAVIDVTLTDADPAFSRRSTGSSPDKWTTKSFTAGDRIGVFATGGLIDADGESQWILNEYMDYEQATGSTSYRFRNDNLLINTGMMGGKVGKYVYFPYTEDMPLPNPDITDPYKDSANNYYYWGGSKDKSSSTSPATSANNFTGIDPERPGMYLRVTDKDHNGNPIEKCIDYMYISNISLTNGALSGGFYHGFSEMIIMRGEGFDQVPEEKRDSIVVVLASGFTRMRLNAFRENTTGNFSFRPQNYYWTPDEEKYGITQEQARRWTAWKGEDYTDMENGIAVMREAYYVILPSAHSYSYPSVSYIEIYNNEGEKCQVSNFELYVNPTTGIGDKQMRPGKCYAVEVVMVEHGATVRPHKIVDWDEGTDGSNDITDERTVGINDYNQLREWAREYNAFITGSSSRPQTIEEVEQSPLKAYGDYDLSQRKWIFYITNDIDIPATNEAGVTDLQDILEGSSKLNNFIISNLKSTFIDKISQGGEMRNLDFEKVYIKQPSSSSAITGVITGNLSGGSITNCNINEGTVISSPTGTVGMICGEVGGTSSITGCKVTGALIGNTYTDTGNYQGLIGSLNAGANLSFTDNDGSSLIIQSY